MGRDRLKAWTLGKNSLAEVGRFREFQHVGQLAAHSYQLFCCGASFPSWGFQILGRPQWKTPASRSRQYVQEICRRIGEDRIELGNACVKVERVGSQPKGFANGLDGKHNYVSNGNGQPHADKAGRSRAGVETEGNAWKATDSKGKPRVFDEVSCSSTCPP